MRIGGVYRPAGSGRRARRLGPGAAARMLDMPHRITLIPGDGIGPEMAEATRRVLDATGIAIEWEVQDAGEATIAERGHAAPGARPRVDPAQQGRAQGPDHDAGRSGLPERQRRRCARRSTCTPTCARRARWQGLEHALRGRRPRHRAREHRGPVRGHRAHGRPDAAESIKIITRAASERIARYAFEYAVANGRHKVTAVHKANIMKLSDGLFLESCRTVAAGYAGRIEFEDRIVDNMCMQLVQKPELYDVHRPAQPVRRHRQRPVRRASSAASASRPARTSATDAAVFEAVHGSAPKYAGHDKANPTALILSAR